MRQLPASHGGPGKMAESGACTPAIREVPLGFRRSLLGPFQKFHRRRGRRGKGEAAGSKTKSEGCAGLKALAFMHLYDHRLEGIYNRKELHQKGA
jgi:hypothetical protein